MIRHVALQRGRRRIGQAAQERIRAGGVLAKGRLSLSLIAWRALCGMLWIRAAGRCEACGMATGLFDPEHAVDRGDGGADSWDNVWVTCRRCHNLKTAPYATGRLRVTVLGDGYFLFEWVRGAKHAFTIERSRVGGRKATHDERAQLKAIAA